MRSKILLLRRLIGRIETFAGLGIVGLLISLYGESLKSLIYWPFISSYTLIFDKSVDECDRLAADPDDFNRKRFPVITDQLSKDALVVCKNAISIDKSLRIKHQYARSLIKFGDKDQISEGERIYNELTLSGYALMNPLIF